MRLQEKTGGIEGIQQLIDFLTIKVDQNDMDDFDAQTISTHLLISQMLTSQKVRSSCQMDYVPWDIIRLISRYLCNHNCSYELTSEPNPERLKSFFIQKWLAYLYLDFVEKARHLDPQSCFILSDAEASELSVCVGEDQSDRSVESEFVAAINKVNSDGSLLGYFRRCIESDEAQQYVQLLRDIDPSRTGEKVTNHSVIEFLDAFNKNPDKSFRDSCVHKWVGKLFESMGDLINGRTTLFDFFQWIKKAEHFLVLMIGSDIVMAREIISCYFSHVRSLDRENDKFYLYDQMVCNLKRMMGFSLNQEGLLINLSEFFSEEYDQLFPSSNKKVRPFIDVYDSPASENMLQRLADLFLKSRDDSLEYFSKDTVRKGEMRKEKTSSEQRPYSSGEKYDDGSEQKTIAEAIMGCEQSSMSIKWWRRTSGKNSFVYMTVLSSFYKKLYFLLGLSSYIGNDAFHLEEYVQEKLRRNFSIDRLCKYFRYNDSMRSQKTLQLYLSDRHLNQAVSLFSLFNLLDLLQVDPSVYNSMIEGDSVKVVRGRLMALYFFLSFSSGQLNINSFQTSEWYEYLFSITSDMDDERLSIIEDILTVYTMTDVDCVYELGITQLLSLFYTVLPESLIKQVISGVVLESDIQYFVDGVELFFSVCQLKYTVKKMTKNEELNITALALLKDVQCCCEEFDRSGINQYTVDWAKRSCAMLVACFQERSISLSVGVHLSETMRQCLFDLLLKNARVAKNFKNKTGRSISQLPDESGKVVLRRQCSIFDIVQLTAFAKTAFNLLDKIFENDEFAFESRLAGVKKVKSNAGQICAEIRKATSDRDYLCLLSDLNVNRLNNVMRFLELALSDRVVKVDDDVMPLVKSFLNQFHDLILMRDNELIPVHEALETIYLKLFGAVHTGGSFLLPFNPSKMVLKSVNQVFCSILSEKRKRSNPLYFLFSANASRLHAVIEFLNTVLTDPAVDLIQNELLCLMRSLLSHYNDFQRLTNISSETVVVGPLMKEQIYSARAGNDVGCCMALNGMAAHNFMCRLSCPSIVIPAVHIYTDACYLKALLWTAKVELESGEMAMIIVFPECQAGIEKDKGNLYLSLLLDWVVKYASICGINTVIFKAPEYGYFAVNGSLVDSLLADAGCFPMLSGKVKKPNYFRSGVPYCVKKDKDPLYLDSVLSNDVDCAFFLTPDLLDSFYPKAYLSATKIFEKLAGDLIKRRLSATENNGMTDALRDELREIAAALLVPAYLSCCGKSDYLLKEKVSSLMKSMDDLGSFHFFNNRRSDVHPMPPSSSPHTVVTSPSHSLCACCLS